MTTAKLQMEIESLPAHLRQEVADFVAFLKTKTAKKTKLKSREFGYAKGKIRLSDDFDEPLDVFSEYQ